MDDLYESQMSSALSVEISLSMLPIDRDKHLAGKQALANTKFKTDGFTSISHSPNFAFGVSAPKNPNLCGIGIDFEEPRHLDIRASKMFLTPDEIAKLENPSSDQLVELWTIKEALFKSTPDNSGLFLRNFQITEKSDLFGRAICLVRPEYSYKFATQQIPKGTLSVAICLPTVKKE